MKTRNGFVSNSSSSSFVIQKKSLSPFQIDCIKNHDILAKNANLDYAEYSWNISETEDTISGYTSMDNFNMFEFLTLHVGINSELMEWER
jgi:hypothetical protein